MPGGLFSCLRFFYDASNKPAIVEYNGAKYAYVHNLQGDIVAILDSNGTAVVQYKYDAWGKPISKTGSMAGTLGTVQPFRYRGYVYDEETDVYYLRSRYYTPMLCRFFNADVIMTRNVFSYCNNKPICLLDPDGYISAHFCVMSVSAEGGNTVNLDSDIHPQFHDSVTDVIQYYIEYPEKYDYQEKGHKRPQNGKPGKICCAYLMYDNWGGHSGSHLRYYGDHSKTGEISDIVALVNAGTPIETFVGYEVYQWLGKYKKGKKHMQHVGRIVLHDFGDGLELAVFQSAKSDSISYCKALFPNDVGGGPNITALFGFEGGTGDWTHYGIPK